MTCEIGWNKNRSPWKSIIDSFKSIMMLLHYVYEAQSSRIFDGSRSLNSSVVNRPLIFHLSWSSGYKKTEEEVFDHTDSNLDRNSRFMGDSLGHVERPGQWSMFYAGCVFKSFQSWRCLQTPLAEFCQAL